MKIDKIISFDIKSEFGFFKKPDVNNPIYFTFNIIPKPTLLGILGAIIGLGGYSEQKDKDYPEFYEKLKDILVGIKPYGNKGVFQKRLIKYNNTVGYANKDGGTLNITEQTLIEPQYKIYLGLDLTNEFHKRIKEFINKTKVQYEYIPYMGKNEFRLEIDDVKHFENIEPFIPTDDFSIATIFPNVSKEALKVNEALEDPFDTSMSETYFYYFERLPIGFDELNQYIYQDFAYINAKMIRDIDLIAKVKLYKVEDKVVCLY